MKRTQLIPVVLLAMLGLMATACSDGLRDAARTDGATGRNASSYDQFPESGYPWQTPNLDTFCSEFTRPFYEDQGSLASCFVLENQALEFQSTDPPTSRLPLYVPKIECGQTHADWDPDDRCVKTPDRFGEVRYYDPKNEWGPRNPFPNPFRNTAAVQFQSSALLAGVDEVVYVGSKSEPFSLDLAPAKASFAIPYIGKNNGSCSNGAFISCELVAGSFSEGGYFQRPRFIFRNRPMTIQITNRTGRSMVLQGSPAVNRDGLLLDRYGSSSDISQIPDKSTVYVAGYRSTAGLQQSWFARYVIKGLTTDQIVTISISLDKDGKNNSSCSVTSEQTVVYKCSTPTLQGDDTYMTLSVNVTSF